MSLRRKGNKRIDNYGKVCYAMGKSVKMQTEQETQYISRKEAAKIVGVDERTIDRWIRDGTLPARKFGNSKSSLVKILKTDFEKFLESRDKV